MRKRVRRVILGLTLLAVLVTLAQPAVYWQFHGWYHGEAFYSGRPTSYWKAEVLRGTTTIYRFHQPERLALDVQIPDSTSKAVRRWVSFHTGLFPSSREPEMITIYKTGKPAVPVLTALLSDPDPRVRGFAAEELRCMGAMAATAIPQLRQLLDDSAEVADGATVGEFVREALEEIRGDGKSDHP